MSFLDDAKEKASEVVQKVKSFIEEKTGKKEDGPIEAAADKVDEVVDDLAGKAEEVL